MALKRNSNIFPEEKKLKKTNKNSETTENLECPQKILKLVNGKRSGSILVEGEK